MRNTHLLTICLVSLFIWGCGNDGAGATKATLKSDTVPQLSALALQDATINIDRARLDAPATLSVSIKVTPGTSIRERGHLIFKGATLYAGDQTMILSKTPEEGEEPEKPEVATASATLKFESQNSRLVNETTIAFSSDNFVEQLVNNMTANMPLVDLCATSQVTLQVNFEASYISYLDDEDKRTTYAPFIVVPLQCAN